MAKVVDNYISQGISGAIGDEMVFRRFKSGTFVGKYADMSSVIPSKNQTKRRNRFAEAVAFAKKVKSDPERSARYKEKNVDSVYHAALKDYLNLYNPDKPAFKLLSPALENKIKNCSLNEDQLRALVYLAEFKKMTNGIYRKINSVSKATATRHLQMMQGLKIIESNGVTGAGACYSMGSFDK